MSRKRNGSILVGADPEFFVRKGTGFISGHTFQCGSKAVPMPTKHGSIQVDGLALECNVKPASTKEEFIRNVYNSFGDLRKFVKSVDILCDIVPASCVFFGVQYLSQLPKEVSKLGCEPDFNAYTKKLNPAPEVISPYRTGAGHIHVGFTEGANVRDLTHLHLCAEIAKQLDFFIGLPSLIFDKEEDSALRRTLYGKAGAFRPKPYGLEYRVLSNKWVEDPELTGFVYDATVRAFKEYQDGNVLHKKYQDIARVWINENVINWAKEGEIGKALAKEILK